MPGLYRRNPLKGKKPPSSSSPLPVPNRMMDSLDDESQQPPPQPRPLGLQLGHYASEPTLKNTLSQHSVPPAHNTYPLANDTYQSQANTSINNEPPESEESDHLHWGTLKPSSPLRPALGLLNEVKEEGEDLASAAMEKEDNANAPSGSASPSKRLSPTWMTVSTPAVDDADPTTDINEPEEEDELESFAQAENVPTPSESTGERTPPPVPLVASVSAPVDRSPLRPLTEHPTPNFSRSLNHTPGKKNLISPTHRMPHNFSPSTSTRSKTTLKQPLSSKMKRARSPSQESSDDMTAGMMPQVRPREQIRSMFNPRPLLPDSLEDGDESSIQSSGEGPSALSSFSSKANTRSQVEQTFIDPQAPNSPALPAGGNPVVLSSPNPNIPKGSDTLVDDSRSDLAPATSPTTRGRFPRHASPSPPPSRMFSQDNDFMRDDIVDDDDDRHSFKATQINPDMPQDESLSPTRAQGSRLFSSASRQPSLHRSPATRAASAVHIPEHRRLQRRAQTSFSEGQQSALIRQFQHHLASPPAADMEPTFVEQAPQPASASSPRASTAQSKDAAAESSEPSPKVLGPARKLRSPVQMEPTRSEGPASPEKLSGIHEPWGESLALPSPVRQSPKKYGDKWNKRRKHSVTSNDPPEDADDEDVGSDSSESTPEDPEDFTYKDPPQPETHMSSMDPIGESPPSPSLPLRPSKAPASPRKIKLRVGSNTTDTRAPASSSRGRGKRKALSPSPELSGPSSGSAPEDNEDYTYIDKGKGKAKTTTRASSRPAKKAKTAPSSNSGPSRKSSRAASIRAASAAPSELPSGTPPVAIPSHGPIRVLACWTKSGQYFPGTIDARMKNGYRVKFDDNDTAIVPAQKMRLLNLKAGEPILAIRRGSRTPEEFQVNAAFNGTADKIRVLDSSSEPVTIAVRNLIVMPDVVEQRFGKRMLDPDVLEERFPAVVGRSSVASTSTTQPLKGMVFVISRGDWRGSVDTLRKRIEKNGGKVEEDWKAIFNIRDDGYEFKTKLAPFVLQMAAPARSVWSKTTMAALASGIPILASRFIDDVDKGADWRNYVVAAGDSSYFSPKDPARPVSQVIDPNWGEPSWNVSTARPVRQAFQDMSVLFLEPTAKSFQDVKTLVPFCLMALGANVRRTKTLPKSLAAYDLVMIEDRDKNSSLSREHRGTGKIVNTAWLKTCLPIGKCLPPAIVATGE